MIVYLPLFDVSYYKFVIENIDISIKFLTSLMCNFVKKKVIFNCKNACVTHIVICYILYFKEINITNLNKKCPLIKIIHIFYEKNTSFSKKKKKL